MGMPGKMKKLASETILSKTTNSSKNKADFQKKLSIESLKIANKSKRLEKGKPQKQAIVNNTSQLSTKINIARKKIPMVEKRKGLIIGVEKKPVKLDKIQPKETLLVDEEVSFKFNGGKAKVK